MKNARSKKTTVQAVMRCSEFKAGFDDYRAGRPLRDDWSGRDRSHIGAQQWSYERGRLLAAWAESMGYTCDPLKVGRVLNDAMVDLFRSALREKVIL